MAVILHKPAEIRRAQSSFLLLVFLCRGIENPGRGHRGVAEDFLLPGTEGTGAEFVNHAGLDIRMRDNQCRRIIRTVLCCYF